MSEIIEYGYYLLVFITIYFITLVTSMTNLNERYENPSLSYYEMEHSEFKRLMELLVFSTLCTVGASILLLLVCGGLLTTAGYAIKASAILLLSSFIVFVLYQFDYANISKTGKSSPLLRPISKPGKKLIGITHSLGIITVFIVGMLAGYESSAHSLERFVVPGICIGSIGGFYFYLFRRKYFEDMRKERENKNDIPMIHVAADELVLLLSYAGLKKSEIINLFSSQFNIKPSEANEFIPNLDTIEKLMSYLSLRRSKKESLNL